MQKPEEKGATRKSGADSRFMFTYVLHFDKVVNCEESMQYGNGNHYVGRSTQLEMRIAEHLMGYGSIVTRASFTQGIRMRLVYILFGDKEKELTEEVKSGKFVCPVCSNSEIKSN